MALAAIAAIAAVAIAAVAIQSHFCPDSITPWLLAYDSSF